MVGVHLLYLEVPSASGADTLLPLIYLAPRVAVEGANAEAMLIVGEDIAVNPPFVLHVRVRHQPRHLLLYLVGIHRP